MTHKMHTFEVSYPQNVQELFEKVVETAGLPKLMPDERFAMEISFVEAVNNAMIHGNKRSSDKRVRIDFSYEDDIFELIITDEGDGFSFEDVPNPVEDNNLTKEGGRGVLLMDNYMDKVEYNAKGNQVRMMKKIKACS